MKSVKLIIFAPKFKNMKVSKIDIFGAKIQIWKSGKLIFSTNILKRWKIIFGAKIQMGYFHDFLNTVFWKVQCLKMRNVNFFDLFRHCHQLRLVAIMPHLEEPFLTFFSKRTLTMISMNFNRCNETWNMIMQWLYLPKMFEFSRQK